MSGRDTLAGELGRRWHELGSVLRSRRLLAALHHGSTATLTPTNLRALDVLAGGDGIRVGELADRVGIDETWGGGRGGRGGVALVVLTGAGAELARVVSDQRRRFFRDVLDALEPGERAELVRLTAKAAEALRATSEELIAR